MTRQIEVAAIRMDSAPASVESRLARAESLITTHLNSARKSPFCPKYSIALLRSYYNKRWQKI